MSNDCKLRFKGVENFLRKIAFNLGNTPSQTEVKIISCIPIDVTDLQQKIIELERKLELSTLKTTTVDYRNINHVAVSCNGLEQVDHRAAAQNKSIASIENSTERTNSKPSANTDSTIPDKSNQGESRLGFFRKKTTAKRTNNKNNHRLVYYAQNESSMNPFNYYLPVNGTSKMGVKKNSNTFDNSDMTDMFRKLYKPDPVTENTSTSEFSTPICRDDISNKKIPMIHLPKSDMCSCCHEPFKNIDNNIYRHNVFEPLLPRKENRNAYYDSNFYDVIPVKENAQKAKNEVLKRHEKLNNFVDIACWPENTRPKYKIPRVISKHHIPAYTRHQIIRRVPVKSSPVKFRREIVLNKMAKLKPVYPSRTRSVEFGEIYAKRLKKTRRKISKVAYKEAAKYHDIACLTTVITNTECQTTSLSLVHSEEHKKEEVNATTTKQSANDTEVTLKQIKNILQTVLAEVKTNSKISYSPEHEKKDAFVQNGPSQCNIFGGSSFLQSFTYSPYNINPYGTSCPPSCYPPNKPHGPLKSMQYPLFVQPGRNMCTNCYKTHPPNNISYGRCAASAATNTEQLQTRSKETENLIKEIYKSIALNLDSSKETPVSERCNDSANIKKSKLSINVNLTKEANIANTIISEIYKNTKPIETSVTPTTTTHDSIVVSNQTSFRDHPGRYKTRDEIHQYNSDNEENSESVDSNETELESDEEDAASDETMMNKEESDYEASNTEFNRVVETVKKHEPKVKQKTSIFIKMLKIFKPKSLHSRQRNRITKNINLVEEESSEHDSDTQTEYSYKGPSKAVYKTVKHKTRTRTHDEPTSVKHVSQRSPFMEQEYRKYFDERLTFNDNRESRYLSTRNTSPQKRPVFYQTIEARSVLTNPTKKNTSVGYNYGTRSNYPTRTMKQGTEKFSASALRQGCGNFSARAMRQGAGNYTCRTMSQSPGHFPARATRQDTGHFPARARWQDTGHLAARAGWGEDTGHFPARAMWHDTGHFPARQDTGHFPARGVDQETRAMRQGPRNFASQGMRPDTGKSSVRATRQNPGNVMRHNNENQTIIHARGFQPAKVTATPNAMAWLKKQNFGIRCGEHWKKLILEG